MQYLGVLLGLETRVGLSVRYQVEHYRMELIEVVKAFAVKLKAS